MRSIYMMSSCKITRYLCVLIVLQLLLSHVCMGQQLEKVYFNPRYAKEYYIQLMPSSKKVEGVLVLLAGFGETPESIFPSSSLFNIAYANNIATIALAGGEKIYADEKVVDKLNSAFAYFLKTNSHIPKDKFVVGGFSAGGTIALRYAEYSVEKSTQIPISIKGVFTIDSPIDLFDLWEYFQREIKKNYAEAGVNEAKLVSAKMKAEIGTPQSNPQRYKELTPFNYRDETLGNEQYLKNMAVRVYHDIDIIWQLKQRRRSLRDSNGLAASELINRLLLMANDRAEFVAAKQPGMRSNGVRHPHSWSIVDEVECIQWALMLLKAN